VSTGIGPPFLQSPDVLATAAGPFSNILETPVDTESESELTDDEEPCCVCQKSSPGGIHQVYGIEFVQWAQCDNRSCNHWIHLRFCYFNQIKHILADFFSNK
jgi:hypothetical protein